MTDQTARLKMGEARIRRVAEAIKRAIVIECHTEQTYGLDYVAAAMAAIKEMEKNNA